DKFSNPFRRLADGLSIGDLRPPHIGINRKLALQPIDYDFKMQLAHPADDRLPGLLIGRDLETGIFGGKALKSEAELFLILAGLGFDGLSDDWCGEFESFKDDRMRFFTNGVA